MVNSHITTDLNANLPPDAGNYNDLHIIGKVAKLEVALTSIGRAYAEVAETKKGIFEFSSKYKDAYCE